MRLYQFHWLSAFAVLALVCLIFQQLVNNHFYNSISQHEISNKGGGDGGSGGKYREKKNMV